MNLRSKYDHEVKLHNGEIVSSWSEEWRLECEAIHLLEMPLHRRREALRIREEKRGKEAVQKLQSVMASIFYGRKRRADAAGSL